MNDDKLGRLEPVELRDAWGSESGDFTPWLAKEKNLKILGDAIGIPLELVRTEQPVQEFSADIHCRDMDTGMPVLIENQLERTDHSHLGQIMTYAAGLEAVVVVWIAQRFTEAHRAALDWLNEITEEKFGFFGVEVGLWRIGDSAPAPRFSVVAKPNDWAREVRASARGQGPTKHQLLQLEYWTEFSEFMAGSRVKCGPAMPKNMMSHPTGNGALILSSVASMFRQGGPGGKAPELRVEFGVWMDEPGPAFAWFKERRAAIEAALGAKLVWDDETYVRYFRAYLPEDGDMRERDKWSTQHKWLREHIEKMYDVLMPLIKEYEARA
jgi:hypothetical protein